MQKVRNEAGITLIEVLATLTIMSILVGIVYGVFVNGLNYSSTANETVKIQQEANILLTVLKEQHEKQKSYSVTVNKIPEEQNRQIVIINNGTNEIRFDNNQYSYQLCNLELPSVSCVNQYQSEFSINIDDTNKKRLYVQIKITNINNPKVFYETKTIFSRL